MMSLMNPAYTSNISKILAEDVNAPELRNPKLSGIRKPRKSLFSRLFKAKTAKK